MVNKKIFLNIIFILTLSLNSVAQHENKLSATRQIQLQRLVDLVKEDKVVELSNLISYPIVRSAPVPNINNKNEFILFYQTLFDDELKQKITHTSYNLDNTIDKYTGFGILSGFIWLDGDGKIIAINYKSDQELMLKNKLHVENENKIHSSVKDWKANILMCKTEKFLIRIDLLDDESIRYISWSNTKDISTKPDLILSNGTTEYHGSMGGVTYSFKNGIWTYVIDEVIMAESEEDMGLFLRVYKNNEQIMSVETEYIKMI